MIAQVKIPIYEVLRYLLLKIMAFAANASFLVESELRLGSLINFVLLDGAFERST